MFVNLIGFLFSLFIVLHIWTMVRIYRQNIQSFLVPLYLYLNGLVIFIELCSLLLLNENFNIFINALFKVRFIAQVFIPPVLFNLVQDYSLSTSLPRFNFKNIMVFGFSSVLSIAAIAGYLFEGAIIKNGMTFPDFSLAYLLFIFYFLGIFYYLFTQFVQKYRTARRKSEIINLRNLLNILLPLGIISFLGLNALPFLDIVHPLIFLAYPVVSSILIFSSFQLNLQEHDEEVLVSILVFATIFVFLIFISFLPIEPNIVLFLLCVPVIIVIYIISNIIQLNFSKLIKKQNLDVDYNLEEELQSFVSDVGKYIEKDAFAEFLANFSRKVLRITKCAIGVPRFDIRPYEFLYIDGFSKENLEQLISNTSSPIIEKMEVEHKILNKFDYTPLSGIYQLMERFNLYLCIPLVTQNSFVGFMLLGGDRKSMRILDKDIRFARFLSVQAANALQNIKAIQRVVQSQKMAELGELASQMAHDFQSFITLSKLEVPENNRLRQQANYMEKLVQDLLNYTRPQELKLALVNINQLIDMSLDLVNIPSNVVVEKHYSESIPNIKVDHNQMRRVFLNFFENCIRAMQEKGGRLKITTRPLRPLSKVKRNPWIYIEILDEGAGIPEEFLDKIFDPFFTTHKHQGGNGMGLAMVKQIITRHHGFIDVASKEGKGTIFNIRLPYLT